MTTITPELATKIIAKLKEIKTGIAVVQKWLEHGTDKDLDFLAEMNATNQEPEQVGEYEATMIVEAPPSIPEIEDLKERLGLEQTGKAELMPQKRFEALCGYVIKGHASGLEVSQKWVNESLINQSLAITSEQEKHLENLRAIRRAMKSKDMDLNQAQGQVGTDVEKKALAEFAKKHNLK